MTMFNFRFIHLIVL